MEASQNQNDLVPCRICVDFYGSAATGGLCSKCCREQVKQSEADKAQTEEILTLIKQNSQNQQKAAAAAASAATSGDKVVEQVVQQLVVSHAAAADVGEDSEMTVEPHKIACEEQQEQAVASQQEVVVEAVGAQAETVAAQLQQVVATTEEPDSEMNNEQAVTEPVAAPVNPVAVAAAEQPVEEEAKVEVQTNLNKCWECSKKVGILKVPCKCSFVFCMKHKHAETHNCTFNYFAQNQERLAKLNPLITHTKMEKC